MSVDADLRSGRQLETGRRSESIIYIYIYIYIQNNTMIFSILSVQHQYLRCQSFVYVN